MPIQFVHPIIIEGLTSLVVWLSEPPKHLFLGQRSNTLPIKVGDYFRWITPISVKLNPGELTVTLL